MVPFRLCFLLTLTAAGPAWAAAVYKCTDAAGRVTLSGSPCAQQEGRQEVVGAPAGSDALRDKASAMAYVKIRQGCFTMGRNPDLFYGSDNELPPHRVCITRDFELGKTEVTQAQWEAVMGSNPSRFKGPDRPVEQVSWNDVHTFIHRLNAKGEGKYRLPTEAEWEYAARAGSEGSYPWGEDQATVLKHAWIDKNGGMQTHPVAQLRPNPWGLYDMLGNVWEWVFDWQSDSYYRNSPINDPRGPATGSTRGVRGGGWNLNEVAARPATRLEQYPDHSSGLLGFRLVREP